ncbi:MAG: hypothetical protein V4654_11940 [Bdellovibrionota bacterium]
MRFLLITVLVIFSIYTGWIVWEFGYTSVFEVTLREHPSTQVLVDLFVTGSILLAIMILDNQRNGRPFRKVLPFVIVTVLAGSIGPLLYFIVYTDLLRLGSNKVN